MSSLTPSKFHGKARGAHLLSQYSNSVAIQNFAGVKYWGGGGGGLYIIFIVVVSEFFWGGPPCLRP